MTQEYPEAPHVVDTPVQRVEGTPTIRDPKEKSVHSRGEVDPLAYENGTHDKVAVMRRCSDQPTVRHCPGMAAVKLAMSSQRIEISPILQRALPSVEIELEHTRDDDVARPVRPALRKSQGRPEARTKTR
jgi:hypothetical protein